MPPFIINTFGNRFIKEKRNVAGFQIIPQSIFNCITMYASTSFMDLLFEESPRNFSCPYNDTRIIWLKNILFENNDLKLK